MVDISIMKPSSDGFNGWDQAARIRVFVAVTPTTYVHEECPRNMKFILCPYQVTSRTVTRFPNIFSLSQIGFRIET